ncbi:MAG TPA: bifunctional oligoribonuclease/PAP phosphatase NrnA [Cyclobacteriaceae bacterium]|nr:bifunctional oligoribonuclease/PAP phosphatase NrnA [Cyclobacteriaceae bacterium]
MSDLQPFKQFMGSPRKAVIITHHKPDADALGSSLGLWAYLKKKGHDVRVISPSDYPGFLHWMPGNAQVLIHDKSTETEVQQRIQTAEVIFCLDFSSLQRINSLGESVSRAAAKKVLIDHHLEPDGFADFSFWDISAAATAELIYDLIYALGDDDLIDEDIANCLYAGLMTDTGGFRHSNTNYKVFNTAAQLVKHGADASKVSKLIYDTNSEERLRLLGFALSEKLIVLQEYATAYISLSEDELKKFSSQTGDTEGIVNYALSIKGIVLAVMIIEKKDEIKLSFRSLGEFSVNDLARKHFEGGGHRNAAGGRTNLSLQATVDKLLALLPEHKTELLKNAR